MRKSHTLEERAKLVRRVQQKTQLGGKTISAACREVGIFDSQYYRWLAAAPKKLSRAEAASMGVPDVPVPESDQARREVEASARDHAANAHFVANLLPTIPASSLQAENDYLWGVIRALARQGAVKIVVDK